jgi:hypothetical protein
LDELENDFFFHSKKLFQDFSMDKISIFQCNHKQASNSYATYNTE